MQKPMVRYSRYSANWLNMNQSATDLSSGRKCSAAAGGSR